MEVFIPCAKSDHLDISGGDGSSSIDSHNSIWCTSANLSMNDLNTSFAKCLTIEDTKISTGGVNPCPRKNDIGNEDNRACECRISDRSGSSSNSSSGKCLSKCASFPLAHGSETFEGVILGDETKHDEGIEVSGDNGSTIPSDQRFLRSISLPVPFKLVSAMKGSREKPKNLSVKWAPDVYDPIPTSVSHVPSNVYLRHHGGGKRSGKYKKGGGKYSRGSNRGKEKKQGWKNGGGSSNKMKAFNNMGGGLGSSIDFDVGSRNSSCERSFLNTSVAKLHFPAAEAT